MIATHTRPLPLHFHDLQTAVEAQEPQSSNGHDKSATRKMKKAKRERRPRDSQKAESGAATTATVEPQSSSQEPRPAKAEKTKVPGKRKQPSSDAAADDAAPEAQSPPQKHGAKHKSRYILFLGTSADPTVTCSQLACAPLLRQPADQCHGRRHLQAL